MYSRVYYSMLGCSLLSVQLTVYDCDCGVKNYVIMVQTWVLSGYM